MNKTKKGFGKAKEGQSTEQSHSMKFTEEEDPANEALIFALEFVEFYSVSSMITLGRFQSQLVSISNNTALQSVESLTYSALIRLH